MFLYHSSIFLYYVTVCAYVADVFIFKNFMYFTSDIRIVSSDKIMQPPFFGGTTVMALYLYIVSFEWTPYYVYVYPLSSLGLIFISLSTALSDRFMIS